MRPLPPDGWWVQPRWISRALEDGELTPTEFTLITYLGGAGLDHYGVSATLGKLAAVVGVCPKTISRSLRTLKELDVVRYDLRQGQRTAFRIRPGPKLSSATSDMTSDVTSDMTSVAGVRSSHEVVRSREADETPSPSSFAPRASPLPVRGHKEEDDEETPPSVSKETVELQPSDVETDDDALLAALGLGSTNEREVLAALALEFPGTLGYWRDERGVRVQRVEELGG